MEENNDDVEKIDAYKKDVLDIIETENYSLSCKNRIQSLFAVNRNLEEYALGELCRDSWLFHRVCAMGDEDLVTYLLPYVDDINMPSPHYGTPLSVACELGYASVVEILLQHGASVPDPEDYEDLTQCRDCFYFSAINGWVIILKLLVENKRDIFKDMCYCTTVLKFACLGGYIVIFKFCVQTFSSIVEDRSALEKFIQSDTLLEICLKYHYSELVSSIIDMGARLTKKLIIKYEDSVSEYLKTGVTHRREQVVIDWKYRSLLGISADWIIPYCDVIVELDISHNQLNILPEVIPWRLKFLKKLIIKHSSLYGIAEPQNGEVLCTNLELVDLSSNEFMNIPSEFFLISSLKHLNIESNSLQSLDISESGDLLWTCDKLEELIANCNDVCELTPRLKQCSSLKKLHISKNNLKRFSESWNCPIKSLDLSSNFISEFLFDISSNWNKTLTELNLSGNYFSEFPLAVCELEMLEVLNLSSNNLISLPYMDLWKCKNLRVLNLSHNDMGLPEQQKTWIQSSSFKKPPSAQLLTLSLDTKTCLPVCLPFIFSKSLVDLNLSFNKLTSVPLSIICMQQLTKLDLSNNVDLKELPAEMSDLQNLEMLNIDGIQFQDANLNRLISKNSTTRVLLAHLRQKHRKFVPYNRLQCVILGRQFHGKTALCKAIQSVSSASKNNESGLNVFETQLQFSANKIKKLFSKLLPNSNPELDLQILDVPGLLDANVDFKPLYSPVCLYLVLFDLRLHNNKDRCLSPLLFDIQAHSSKALVIVVGTFLDCLVEGREMLNDLRVHIYDVYSVKQGFPRIIDVVFVSNIGNREGIDCLKQSIYYAFQKFNIGVYSDLEPSEATSSRRVPKDYVDLINVINEERKLRKEVGFPQMLNKIQFLNMINKTGSMKMKTSEDISLAGKFLQDAGHVIHFPRDYGDLSLWYFIDMKWLADNLLTQIRAETSSSSEKLEYIGTVGKNQLKEIFSFSLSSSNYLFSQDDEIKLLEAFGMIHKMFGSYLLSHKIPFECPLTSDFNPSCSDTVFMRLYKMRHVPCGFIKNFLVRMISWCQDDRENYIFSRRSEKFKLFSYWRKGIVVETSSCCLKVECVESDVLFDGFFISAFQSKSDSISALYNIFALAVEITNDLIEQCFPGLFDEGCLEILVPCSHCFRNGKPSVMISLFDCIKKIMLSKSTIEMTISCPEESDVQVPLDSLVPDLLLLDLPAKLHVHPEEMVYNKETDVIGRGGEGVVYKGVFRNVSVAIKQSDVMMMKCMKLGNNPDQQGDHDQKEAFGEEVMEGFWKQKMLCTLIGYRHETTTLAILKHPCLISMLGICVVGLSYIMELSPIGSLRSVMISSWSEISFFMKYKICSQIISALKYFHEKKLVYKDMKPENVLVWSLLPNDFISIKLSDYGLTKRLFASGIKGVEGTSGYQAPEMWLDKPYNEKVDIFAFAMVAYELFTGDRSFLEDFSLSVNKKVQQGDRPSKGFDDYLLPKLKSLITKSWAQDPEERPSADNLEEMVKDLSLIMLEGSTSLQESKIIGAISATFLSTWVDTYLYMWSGKDSGRCCHIYDVMENNFKSVNLCCPGSMVTCFSLINPNLLVVGTEEPSIEIIECNVKSLKKLFKYQTASQPSMMLNSVDKQSNRIVGIYVGFTSGNLRFYNFIDNNIQQQSDLMIQENNPIKTIAFISNLIWVGCGSQLCIIEHSDDKLSVLKILETPYFINKDSYITSISCHGDQLWCCYGSLGIIVEIDSETLSIICIFDCKDAQSGNIVTYFDFQDLLKIVPSKSKNVENLIRDLSDTDTLNSGGGRNTILPQVKYLNSRRKRSMIRRRDKKIKKEEIATAVETEIKDVFYHFGMLWVVLGCNKLILINVTRENMFDLEYGQVLNVMKGEDSEDGARVEHVARFVTAEKDKLFVATSHKEKTSPYKTVRLTRWAHHDLTSIQSYQSIHKQLQSAINYESIL